MISALKWQIRLWEREGRHKWFTRAATFAWLSIGNLSDRVTISRIRNRLKSDEFPKDVDAAVAEICEGPAGAGIRPMQAPAELAELIHLIDERKPKTILEIGTARGGTLCLMCRFAAEDAVIVSVDLPYARNGGGYPRWKEKYYRAFALAGQKLHLMRANSHASSTIDRVKAIVGDAGFDFVLIDADHSYDGVRYDYTNYRPLLAEGGLLALHDVLPNENDPSIDVNRFWETLESDESIKTDTIIDDPQQGMYGIGLVHG